MITVDLKQREDIQAGWILSSSDSDMAFAVKKEIIRLLFEEEN